MEAIDNMHSEERWVVDSLDICQECEHPLCNGQCERQVPYQLILGGLFGAAVLFIALLIRVVA